MNNLSLKKFPASLAFQPFDRRKGSALSFAALPPDVRKGSAFPTSSFRVSGLCPEVLGRSPERVSTLLERAKPFRTSGGRAAMMLLGAVLALSFFCGEILAQERTLQISVVDLQDKPIEFVQLTTTAKSTTEVTNSDGKATIKLLENTPINSEVGLRITGTPKDKDYVFISPWDKRVVVPSKVTIVLAERGIRQLLEDPRALRALASNIIRDEAPGSSLGDSPELRREVAIAEVAKQFELPKDEIIRAIQAWGEKAKDPYDKAQADFIAKNYAKASAGFAEARRLRKAATEKAISEEFDACFSHGQSLFEEGKYRESAEAYQEALELRKDESATMNNLALSLKRAGKYIEAEPLYKRSLAIKEKALGADHPEVAVTLNNLAGLYEAQGKYIEAEPLYKRSLAMKEKALGADHPSVAVTLNNFAELYRKQGKYNEAEPLYKLAIVIYEKAFGGDHPDLATLLNNYALLLAKLNRNEEAAKLEDRAAKIKAKHKQRNPGN